jgi:hypothetical protein
MQIAIANSKAYGLGSHRSRQGPCRASDKGRFIAKLWAIYNNPRGAEWQSVGEASLERRNQNERDS